VNEPDSSDQKRMMLFIIFSFLLFVAMSMIFKPQPQQQPQQTKEATSPGPGGASTNPPAGQFPSAPSAPAKPAAASTPVVTESAEKTVAIESALYRVELSNRGAVVRSWTLKKYFDDQKQPRPLDLVNADTSRELGWPMSLALQDTAAESQANAALYQVKVTQSGGEAVASQSGAFEAPAEVAFTWSDGHTSVTKKLKFSVDYELSIEASVTRDGYAQPVALAWLGGFGDKEVYRAAQYLTVFYEQNDKLTTLQMKKLGAAGDQSKRAQRGDPLEFGGIMDQFFTASFLADGPNLTQWDWVGNHKVVVDDKPATEPVAELAVGSVSPGPLAMRAFVGPKDLRLLSHLRPSLEGLVQFGWTGVIAKPLLYALEWLHQYIPNYGWAIVVFTLALTMVLFPVRLWTFRSARKMQSVAPEIKSIQDRYKKYSFSDPRKKKMNEEVMAVYQREGINPMGSCLPMLVQLPILWAFYRTLTGAIELRHAPWIWWIHDLSAPDHYFVLPVVLAVSTYLSTKLTPMPTTGDPAQQKMMMFMPLMTAFIFFYLSSGLNLYYFTSNLVNVVQQVYLNKTHPLPTKSKFKKNDRE
jgi:YidC/Oxa1 family membrane protein insertase